MSDATRSEGAGLAAVVEPALGGRWASLIGPGGREWLWRRPEALADRAAVRPGDPFVDAGGFEECFPTVAGASDHGEVWDRPWRPEGEWLAVEGAGFRLRRRLEAAAGGSLVARYRLEAEPGFRFVWAGHAEIECSRQARLVVPPGTWVRVWPEHWRRAPDYEEREGPWPAPLGERLDTLGEDGSAVFFMLLGTGEAEVEDRGERLRFALAAPGQPIGVAVWRNLGGWPDGAPYRSLAIEPAIGWHFDRDRAAAGEVGTVPEGGVVEWSLRVWASA